LTTWRAKLRAGIDALSRILGPTGPTNGEGGADQTTSISDSKFRSNLLQWPVIRSTRAFRVFVVEPEEYRPEIHSSIFNTPITHLIIPEQRPVDPYLVAPVPSSIEPFDLITFPEAFLPQAAFLTAVCGELLILGKSVIRHTQVPCPPFDPADVRAVQPRPEGKLFPRPAPAGAGRLPSAHDDGADRGLQTRSRRVTSAPEPG